jgi:hypothetical protein
VNAVGMKQFRNMEFVEQMRRLYEMKERYANEFEQHGLANLKINK